MAAFAALTIPVVVPSSQSVADVLKILAETPGATEIAVDAAAGTATLQLQFPGNIDFIMRKLAKRGLSVASSVAISVPVRNLSGRDVKPLALVGNLDASPAISGATYDGERVSARIVPMTASMRYMYEEIIRAGLTAVDMPTIAGKQEFVI